MNVLATSEPDSMTRRSCHEPGVTEFCAQNAANWAAVPLYVSRSHGPMPGTGVVTTPFWPSVYCHIVHEDHAGCGMSGAAPYSAYHSQQLARIAFDDPPSRPFA